MPNLQDGSPSRSAGQLCWLGRFLLCAGRNPEDLPEDYICKSFSMMTKCSNHTCGEAVGVIGSYSYKEAETAHGWGLTQALTIKGIHLAPPMVDLPDETPQSVAVKLRNAFELYWVDYGACLNAVRSSGE